MQTSIDGFRMGYADEGTGAPLVLLHGFPFRRDVWAPQIAALKAGRRVIAPDLAGFGDSDASAGPVTMERFADGVRALLQHLKTGPVVLAGHSMGGYVALAFARKYPRMLKGLALVATRAGADTPEGAAARRATAEKVRAQGIQVIVDAMAPKMISPANAHLDPAVRGLMSPSNVEGVTGALLGMAERPDLTPILPRIAVPTLAITGADDALIPPAESEKMAKSIPGARLEILPNAGHLVAYERPEEFNRILTEWLGAIR